LLDLDLAELAEIIDDAPFKVAVMTCCKTIKQLLSQQHGQQAAEHLSA
jgi:hypothetical protein